MQKKTNWKLIVVTLVSLVALYLLAPTLYILANPNAEGKLPKWMPNTAMKLGLDLRGGIHMVMGVDLDEVVRTQLTVYGNSIEKTAATDGLKVDSKVEGDELHLTLLEGTDKAKFDAFLKAKFNGVVDIVRDEGNILSARLRPDQETYIREHALDQSIETIRNRIDEFGVSEPILSRKGDSQILVQFPGEQEPERLKGLIGQTAKLNFQMVHECMNTNAQADCLPRWRADLAQKIKDAETKGAYGRDTFKAFSEYRARLNQDLKASLPPNTELAFEKTPDLNQPGKFNFIPFVLSTKDMLSGEYIENAYVTTSNDPGSMNRDPVVAFQMNAAGVKPFAELTSNNRSHFMAIVLDGMVRSAPSINNPITEGSGIITVGSGNFDEINKEARDLSIVLRAGALPAKIETQEERVIGPSIGEDAIVSGRNALIVASILIFLFIWTYYGVVGLLANFVTLINVAVIFGILGLVGATLTLPGIAGIVLTLGMAVDALVIIFERMREETRAGRSRRQVIEMGFDKAFTSILDSNVTTAIGGFVLLNYGTGSIRGFALTLLVGIIANLFMATFFTKALFEAIFSDSDKPMTMGLSQTELTEIHAAR